MTYIVRARPLHGGAIRHEYEENELQEAVQRYAELYADDGIGELEFIDE